jgi:hypothetical protein
MQEEPEVREHIRAGLGSYGVPALFALCPGFSVAASMLACDAERQRERMSRAVSVEQGSNLRCPLV